MQPIMQIVRVLLAATLILSITTIPIDATTRRRTQRTAQRGTTARRRPMAKASAPANSDATSGSTKSTADAHPATPPKVIEIPNDQLLPAPIGAPTNLQAFQEVGHGTAIIFTPDLAGPVNREFYQALGFLYIQETSWSVVLDQLISYNQAHPETPINRIILETHGSWGDGLKLQDSKEPHANRSYISLGGLQERLESSGVKECILSACNSGRLLRPEIYKQLDASTLLPANQGFINASKRYRPTANSLKIMRRQESRFEALTPLFVAEMPAVLRAHMGVSDGEAQFVVSDLFLEYVLNDPNLNLIDAGFVNQISIRDYSVDHSEALINRFFTMLNEIASAEKRDHRDHLANSKALATTSSH